MSADLPATETGAPDLDFEGWARLSARLLKLDEDARLDLLDERGIDPDDWMRWDEQYALVLADDIAADRMERAESYGLLCAAELERRRQGPVAAPEEAVAPPEAEPPPPLAETPVVAAASFQKAPPPDVPAPAPVPAPALVSMPTRAPAELTGTTEIVDIRSILKQAAELMPFTPAAAPTLAPAPTAPSSPALDAGATVGVGTDLMAQMRAALPFAGTPVTPTAAPSFPRLPLASYASLCAELAVFPERAVETLRKYGVQGEASLRALDEDWQGRFSRHADTHAEWLKLLMTYQTWLRQQKK